jgi:hypothetical protein
MYTFYLKTIIHALNINQLAIHTYQKIDKCLLIKTKKRKGCYFLTSKNVLKLAVNLSETYTLHHEDKYPTISAKMLERIQERHRAR